MIYPRYINVQTYGQKWTELYIIHATNRLYNCPHAGTIFLFISLHELGPLVRKTYIVSTPSWSFLMSLLYRFPSNDNLRNPLLSPKSLVTLSDSNRTNPQKTC